MPPIQPNAASPPTALRIGNDDVVPAARPRLSSLRVAKTYASEQPGARRFARRYGEQLLCVRQRLDNTGTVRHTTVELPIETTPVASRARSIVAVRIAPTDRATRKLLLASGAEWRPPEKYWLLPRLVAKNLGLLRNVVARKG